MCSNLRLLSSQNWSAKQQLVDSDDADDKESVEKNRSMTLCAHTAVNHSLALSFMQCQPCCCRRLTLNTTTTISSIIHISAQVCMISLRRPGQKTLLSTTFAAFTKSHPRFVSMLVAFSALTLLVGWQEGHPVCKKWRMVEGSTG